MKSITALALLAAVLLPPCALAQSSGAFSFGTQKIETSAETVEVTAKGQGESIESARKDAVRNMSEGERVASAEELLAERLKGFPGALVEAVMLAKGDGSPDIGIDEKTGHVFANVGVQVNMENYTKWTEALCELLGQICMAQEDVPIKFNEADPSFPDRIASDAIPLRSFSKEEVFGSPDLTGFPVSMTVVVAVPSASKVRRSTWPAKVFYLNSKMWNAFMRKFAERFPESGYVEITLKDRDGDPVCAGRETFTIVKNGVSILGSRSLVPAHAISTSGTWKAFIAPALKLDGKRGGLERNRDLAVKMRIDLGKAEEDDLAAVVGYDVKTEYR